MLRKRPTSGTSSAWNRAKQPEEMTCRSCNAGFRPFADSPMIIPLPSSITSTAFDYLLPKNSTPSLTTSTYRCWIGLPIAPPCPFLWDKALQEGRDLREEVNIPFPPKKSYPKRQKLYYRRTVAASGAAIGSVAVGFLSILQPILAVSGISLPNIFFR
jgi:hypothetical protein